MPKRSFMGGIARFAFGLGLVVALASCNVVGDGMSVSSGLPPKDSTLPAPRFSPEGGFDSVPHAVAILASDSTYIVYTTDGSRPTAKSRRYRGPVLVDSSMTLQAMALHVRWKWASPAASARFTVGKGSTTFLDPRDGESYRTVKIGNQVWMAENLRYNEGSSGNAWSETTADSIRLAGKIYTWSVVMGGECAKETCRSGSRGICPPGWHVPLHQDWADLGGFVGMDSGGRLLKSRTGWSDSGKGTDDYGFCALPNMQKLILFQYEDVGVWWTSTGASFHNPFQAFAVKTWMMRSAIMLTPPMPVYALDSSKWSDPGAKLPVRCLLD